MKNTLKYLFGIVHRLLAPAPKIVVRPYFAVISAISRRLPDHWATHIQSSVGGLSLPWKHREFPARVVKVGRATTIRLMPHLGEFDERALFSTDLPYEREVFEWLERNAPASYDIVIEIGANVGVYTCFFDALIKRSPSSRLKEVIAFEPSPEAYRRLLNNLAINEAIAAYPFNAAIATTSGFMPFFEPTGHLTNGSFLRQFSEIFSTDVVERRVISLAVSDLADFLGRRHHPLIKLDVEGYEGQLLSQMEGLVGEHKPDLMIEVLGEAPDEIEAIEFLRPYRRMLITKEGLEAHPRLFANPDSRDWLLLHPDSPIESGG